MGRTATKTMNEQLAPAMDPAQQVAEHTGDTTIQPDLKLYDADAPLTAALIEARISSAMALIQLACTDREQYLQDARGRLLRKDRPLNNRDEGAEGDAVTELKEVTANRFRWKERRMLNSFVYGTEAALTREEGDIAAQQETLRKTLRLAERGIKTQGNVDFEANKLEAMLEQKAVSLALFRAAVRSYEELTGEEYETAAMRAERQKLERTPSGTNLGKTDDRIARLLGA